VPILPTTGLTGSPVNDHITHHEGLHDFNNKLVAAGSVGQVPVKDTASSSVASIVMRQPHYSYAEHTKTVTHATSGVLSFAVDASTRVVKVNASANITDITVAGMANLGVWGMVWVQLNATAAITIAFSSATVVGGSPSSMAAGQSTVFAYQTWNF
jgi:hypothetical protein